MEAEEQPRVMDDILELIPNDQLSFEQKAFIPSKYSDHLPFYRFRREPSSLLDIDWEKHAELTIWRDNKTLICISKEPRSQFDERYLFFTIFDEDKALECATYGKDDASIAETVTFFCSLEHPDAINALSEIGRYEALQSERDFDFSALQPEQLAQILDSNPTRSADFRKGILSEAQSIILATRSYPLELELTTSYVRGGVSFVDQGSSFVDALESRQSSFGSLCFDSTINPMPFSSSNLKRLLQLDGMFETLTLGSVYEEIVLLPLTAKVNKLTYEMDIKYIPSSTDSLDIVATDLDLKLYLEDDLDNDWAGLVVSVLHRIAELGHFDRLTFSVTRKSDEEDEPLDMDGTVTEALMRAIQANPQLSYMDLSYTHYRFDWTPYLPSIFEVMKDHIGLRTFVLADKYYRPNHPIFSWLEQLLSRNRTITVLDVNNNRCTNGSRIDKLYELNRFYNGSVLLLKEESTSLRPLLVATALTESASRNSQFAALLLSNHTDMLRELLDGADLEDVDDGAVEGVALEESLPADSLEQTTDHNLKLKRKRELR